MKNFSDLLATDTWLEIAIQVKSHTILLRWPLITNLDLCCQGPTSVKIDGMEVIEFGYQDQGMWRITLHESFYRWQHRVTGQGWLLMPRRSPACKDSND